MRTVIGVMGSGAALDEAAYARAYSLGALIATRGWVLLTGGSAGGVMHAASHGAQDAGGLVIGVLKGETAEGATPHLDIAVPTGMGDARNAINVLASEVVVALPGGAGTLSEVALGLKAGKTVVAVDWHPGEALRRSGPGTLVLVDSVAEAVDHVAGVIDRRSEGHACRSEDM